MVATQDIEATVIGQARTWDARPMALRPRVEAPCRPLLWRHSLPQRGSMSLDAR
jgi:hypothetical protein